MVPVQLLGEGSAGVLFDLLPELRLVSVLGFGSWVLGLGFWVLGSGFWVVGFGFWVLGLGFEIKGLGFGAWGSGLRVVMNRRR